MKNINTVKYWDGRFETQLGYSDWEMCNGTKQSKDFMKGILNNIPKNVKSDMCNSTVLDVGCALGDGTNLLMEKLSNDKITGYDFSKNALSIASKNYKDIKFINELTGLYDYIICSNVLQCVDDYKLFLKNLIEHTNKCLFILVPLGNLGVGKEHYNIFQTKDFPKSIECFSRRAIKTIIVQSWTYKQILIRYERMD